MKQNARTAAGLLALGAAMAVPLLAACIPVKSDNEDALDKIRLSMLMATSADCLRAKAALTQLNRWRPHSEGVWLPARCRFERNP